MLIKIVGLIANKNKVLVNGVAQRDYVVQKKITQKAMDVMEQ